MTGAINNLAASLSGAPAAAAASSRVKAKQTFEETYKRRLIKDEYNAAVDEVEHTNAVRSLADADEEESREDRQEHADGYPHQKLIRPKPGRLDLNA